MYYRHAGNIWYYVINCNFVIFWIVQNYALTNVSFNVLTKI